MINNNTISRIYILTNRRHDIAEILLKVALNTKNQSINHTDKSVS